MAGSSETKNNPGGSFSELVPVLEPNAVPALPHPVQTVPGSPAELADLLSDALFGEVIDISDLVPRMLSSPTETPAALSVPVDAATEAASSFDQVAAMSVHVETLTILYDDDMQISGSDIQ